MSSKKNNDKGGSKRTGPSTLEGSREAKRQAAMFLEVLAGLRSPAEAAEGLDIALSRYYILETRGLQGMIGALEPRPRGRQQTAEGRIAALEQEISRLERELARHQALVRSAQRAIGLPAPAKNSKKRKGGGKSKRRRRPRVRAMKVISALQDAEATTVEGPEGTEVRNDDATAA